MPYPAADALKGAMTPYRLAVGKYVHAETMPEENEVRPRDAGGIRYGFLTVFK